MFEKENALQIEHDSLCSQIVTLVVPFFCSRLEKQSNICLSSRGREYVLVCDVFSPPLVY